MAIVRWEDGLDCAEHCERLLSGQPKSAQLDPEIVRGVQAKCRAQMGLPPLKADKAHND